MINHLLFIFSLWQKDYPCPSRKHKDYCHIYDRIQEIPLSARIMAVADVFDALTSPRVYKPAFSLEKALSILEEESGKQFDPKCVEAFMDSLTDVKRILKKYNG